MRTPARDNWLHHLRSTEQEQAFDRLINEDGCCALGVLVEPLGLYPVETGTTSRIQEHLELSNKGIDFVVALNDQKRYSFHEIANIIENNEHMLETDEDVDLCLW